MPQTRQPADEATIAVRSLALGIPHRHAIDEHAHAWPQLVFATTGLLTVDAEHRSWIVPTARALWVPPNLPHALRATGTVHLRTIYVRPDHARRLPRECTVVAVSPFLRELVVLIVGRGLLDEARPTDRRLVGVLLDQLADLPRVPLALRLPTDERARRVAERVLEHPGGAESLAELGARSGASKRTLERLFQQDTGMTFGRWRQQVRLFHALELLTQGRSVTATALDVGYDSTSAFIAMFRKALGTTPRRYAVAREA